MNFDFSEEQDLLREQARRFLSDQGATARARKLLDAGGGFDRELWQGMAELGWLGAALPEHYGGAGLSYVDLCVLAEEIGRANAAVPFSSSVYMAAEAIYRYGSDAQKDTWLTKLISGEAIGSFAAAEGNGPLRIEQLHTQFTAGKTNGTKTPVSDGMEADVLVTLVNAEQGAQLYLIDLNAEGVTRESLTMTDGSRPAARIEFNDAAATLLPGATSAKVWHTLLDRAAILVAFEQVGGAEACLEMARDYARDRYAFGRPIGSFQAIKHKLADVYVANQLARSNAYFGAWALNADAPELPVAAAAARVAGCRAFDLASKENIQTHGGMGFTWDLDCHLYYRRAKALGVGLGSARVWKNRLVGRLQMRNAA